MKDDGLRKIEAKLQLARWIGIDPAKVGVEHTVEAIDLISLDVATKAFNSERLSARDSELLALLKLAKENCEIAEWMLDEAASHSVVRLAVLDLLGQKYGPVFLEDKNGEYVQPKAADRACKFFYESVIVYLREFVMAKPEDRNIKFGVSPADLGVDLELLLQMYDSGLIESDALSGVISEPSEYRLWLKEWNKLKGTDNQTE